MMAGKGRSLGHLSSPLRGRHLSLDLLAGPSSSLNGAPLKVAVSFCVFDQLCEPFGTVVLGILAVREGVCQIAGDVH